MFSDINLSQMIFTKTPASWHPYIKLTRIDRPIGIWLLLIPCFWSLLMANGGFLGLNGTLAKYLVLFTLGAVLMRAAGCIVNDLWDKDLDASVDRTRLRPLAAGEITVRNALRFLSILLFLSLLILLALPHLAIVLGVLSIGLVVAYPYMKRITWVPQLFLGLTFNWGALMGWAAATEHIGKPAILLYIAGIFWTLAYDTIYAHQDKEDDIRIGIKSTARLFGESSKLFVSGFFFLSLVFVIWARYATEGHASFLTPLLTALPTASAGWIVWNWDMNDPQSCLKMFKLNQVYGWLVLLLLCL